MYMPTEQEIQQAKLPDRYQAAVQALAECESYDELSEWRDKASAIAAYAKQRDDDQLENYAKRIKGRAIRRIGLLLKEIEPDKGGYHKNYAQDATDPSTTRTQAATDAGLSERQRKSSLNVANIPESEFEEQIESDNPPSVSKLAEHGKAAAPKPEGFKQATKLIGTVKRFSEFCNKTSAELAANGVQSHEVEEVKKQVEIIDSWLDSFVTKL